jgi:predicted  nucleic acid-binding Zn-ribbon protein
MLELISRMQPDLATIIRLQSLDDRIAELQREIAALPKHIMEIEKALDQHLRKLERDRAALAGNQKERKRLEGEIQVQEQKVSKLKDQMQLAKTNDQFRAFQHEIEFCQKEIRKLEDRILDLMSESEPLELNVKSAETALKEEKQNVESEKKAAQERTGADMKQLAELEAERTQLASSIPPQVFSSYERIRKKRHGQAVAEASDGRCSACQLALRPQFFQELRMGDEVLFCESCGRILYYNPPVSFEDQVEPAGAPDPALPARQ